jgi:hypothetical protein
MTKDTALSLFIVFLLFAAMGYIDHMLRETDKAKVIRDCSITGAHIISNDTVIVCRVVKVDQARAPTVPKEKPEITL